MIQLVIYILLQLGLATGNPLPNTGDNDTNTTQQPIGNGGWDFDNN